ncbi:MAG TPA: CHAD domain-containing protein, partial [Thermoanaerobaculaceae bacterium]|nr:CHAD domain-containing protein [Thermoanaerobaculaceae bacterium]
MKSEFVLRWPRTVSAIGVLDALDATGLRVSRTRGRECTEVHWDTQDGALRAAAATLVHHVEDGTWALASARESFVEPGSGAAPLPGGQIAAAVLDATRGRPLIPFLAGTIEEEVFAAVPPRGKPVQVALRRWVFTSPLRPGARARRAFIHVSGAAAGVNRAARALNELAGCPRTTGPLLELGLIALRLTAPGKQPAARFQLRASDTVAAAFGKLLARQAWAIAATAPGVATDLDLEYVHDLRVAARRARGLLRLARLAGVNLEDELAEELAWLAHACGPLRDLDVFLTWVAAELASAGAAPEIRDAILLVLSERRRVAFEAARVAVTSPRLGALLALMRRQPPSVPAGSPGALPVGTVAATLVGGEVRRLARWRRHDAATLTDGEVHRIRIAGKRARYALEFFAPVLAPDVRRVVRTLVRVQDTLGAHQDASFAVG